MGVREENLTEGLFSRHLNSFLLTPRNGVGREGGGDTNCLQASMPV